MILSGGRPHEDDEFEKNDSDLDPEDIPDIRYLGFDSELDQVIYDTRTIIQCLLRLSIAIRNPAPHDLFLASRKVDTSHYEPYDVQHVISKFPRADGDVAKRLGVSISRRREYFRYRQSHHERLAAGLDFDENQSEMQSTVASSIPSALKDSKSNDPAETMLEYDDRSDAASQTSFATPMLGSEKPRIPPLPRQSADGPFQCPFCYMIIQVSTNLQWK